MTPRDLLELARAAGQSHKGRHSPGPCSSCAANERYRSACTPARIVALCERLEEATYGSHRCHDRYCACNNPMTTPLDAQPETNDG